MRGWLLSSLLRSRRAIPYALELRVADVRVFEEPQGYWFGIAAEVSVGSDGVGTNSAVLHGSQGPVGRITQNQLVTRPDHPNLR